MPQLDSLSWFNQVGSTIGVIFIFYFLLSLLFLPTLSAITKGRFKLQNLRKILNVFYINQLNLLVQAGQQNLALVLFNNLYVIDAYYAPVFTFELQAELVKNTFNLADAEIIENIFADKASINFINVAEIDIDEIDEIDEIEELDEELIDDTF